MRVLLNGLTALKPRTGIGQYTARLAEEMAKLLPGDFAVYPPEYLARVAKRFFDGSGAMPTALRGHVKQSHQSMPTQSRGHGTRRVFASAAKQFGRAATSLHFANYCRTYGAKLYHEPNYLPLASGIPTVITIHDLSVILHPEWHPADRVREHAKKLERAAANAAHIITDTEQVKREVIKELRVSAAKITAIPLGVGAEFRPSPRLAELPDQYFLCVGTIEPRKNLLMAMKAFASLPKQMRERCPLLLAGPWGWKADAEREYFDRIGADAGIRHLGYIPDEAMPSLYSGAVATLYPSLYEGFGLPPLEAVACGSRTICSRGTLAVKEVMGSMATYCDAHDIDEWRDAMKHSLTPLPFREGMGEGSSRRTARFTWARTASDTLGVYNRVLFGEVSQARAA